MPHPFVFRAVFPWEDDDFRFAPIMYLEAALQASDAMPQEAFEEIIEKPAEISVAHPFREGNGRSTRIWLDAILRQQLGKVFDWSCVDKQDYLFAMERRLVRDTEIKFLLKSALADKANDREAFMKGIDASYGYEGYSTYTMSDLRK